MAHVSSTQMLNGLIEQGADWINYLVSADEPRGDIGDSANARAEIYRLQALFQMLSAKVRPGCGPHKMPGLAKRASSRRSKTLPRPKKQSEHSRQRTKKEFAGSER